MKLETLIAEREIYRALVQFARAMDNRDWDQLLDLMTEDATGSLGTGELDSPQAIVSLIRVYLDGCGTTQHLLGNILIDVHGDTATSTAYVSDMHLAAGDGPDRTFRTLGEYTDQWLCRDGVWLIKRRDKNNRATVGDMSVFSAKDQ